MPIPKNYLMFLTSLGYLGGALQYGLQGRTLLALAVLFWGLGNLIISFI